MTHLVEQLDGRSRDGHRGHARRGVARARHARAGRADAAHADDRRQGQGRNRGTRRFASSSITGWKRGTWSARRGRTCGNGGVCGGLSRVRGRADGRARRARARDLHRARRSCSRRQECRSPTRWRGARSARTAGGREVRPAPPGRGRPDRDWPDSAILGARLPAGVPVAKRHCFQNSRLAIRAPSASERSLAQTTSGSTAACPTHVP